MTEQWRDELTVYTRAYAGAAVFGVPLVYTMEMWWIGKTLSITHLMIAVAIAFIANLGLAHVAGFRNESTLLISFDQAIDALAVGIVSAAVLLFSMNQLRITDGIEQGIGMVILLALPLSVGASVAKEVFSGRTGKDGDEESHLSVWQGLFADIGATAIGGTFIAMTIAPTEEVEMVAAGLQGWHVFLLIGLSLFISYLIVFASGFDEVAPDGPFQHAFSETMLSYVIALLVAFALLYLFGRLTMDDPFNEIVRQTVVLALPAAIGGAGGRLVI